MLFLLDAPARVPIRAVGACLLTFLIGCGVAAPTHDRAPTRDGVRSTSADDAFEHATYSLDGWPRAFTVAPGRRVPRARFVAAHGAALGLGPDDALIEERTTDEGDARSSTRYAHFYKGVLVAGSGFVLHEAHGVVVEGNGHLVRGLHADVVPRIEESVARDVALRTTAGAGAGVARVPGASELALVPTTARGDARGYRLARIYAIARGADLPVRAVAVDAASGELLASRAAVESVANVQLRGQTYYDGVQPIVASSDGAGDEPPYTLATQATPPALPAIEVACPRREDDPNPASEPLAPFTSSEARASDGLTRFSAPGTDCRDERDGSIAVQAAWAAETTSNDWSQTFGWSRASSHPNSPLRFVVDKVSHSAHYIPGVFGDDIVDLGFMGDRPLVSLDVIAHEMGHDMLYAIAGHRWLQTTLALFPEWGSLNEGLADIFALEVNNRYRLSRLLAPSWTIGATETRGTACEGIRDASAPKRFGQPDAYEGRFWDDGRDPHTDAAFLDHWFYLLAAGGTGTIDESSDASRTYTVVRIDTTSTMASIALAARVAQTAFEMTTFGSNFHDFHDATLLDGVTASLDLTDAQVQSIKEAWYAVGIGDSPDMPAFFPSDGETNVEPWTVDLQWRSDSASAASWTVEIARTEDELTNESGPSFQTATVRANASGFRIGQELFGKYDDFVLDPSATYVWRVRSSPTIGCSAAAEAPPWSDVHGFTTASKAALRTDPGEDPVAPWSVRFAWQQVPGARGYGLDVWSPGQDPDESARHYEVSGGGATEIALPLPSRQSFDWRVQTYGPRATIDGPRSSDLSDTGLVSTGEVPAATAVSRSSSAWDYRIRIEAPAGADHTLVDHSGHTEHVRNSGDPSADTLALHSSSLDMGSDTFDFDLTPVGPAPFVPLTPGCTQTAGSTDPFDPETGPTTRQALPVDWGGTTPQWGPTTGPTCDYGEPIVFQFEPPKDARGPTKYLLTLTPKSGGPPQTYTTTRNANASDPNLGDWPGIEVTDGCTDTSGYTETVQAFKNGSELDPGAPATRSYAMQIEGPFDLSPGAPVISHVEPPTVDATAPVTFSWAAHHAPYGYELVVMESMSPVVKQLLAETDTTYSASLKRGTTYVWFVEAVQPGAREHAYSETYTFTTAGLVAPTPIAPANGAPVDARGSVPFEWTKVATADGMYVFSVSFHGSHDPVISDRWVKGTRFTAEPYTFLEGFDYDWSVKSIGGGGNTAASPQATFTTKAPPRRSSPAPLEGVAGITCSCTYGWFAPDCYVAWDDGIPAAANEWEIQLTGELPSGYAGPTAFVFGPGDPGFRRGSSGSSAEYDFYLPPGNANVTIDIQARDTRTRAESPWVTCQP